MKNLFDVALVNQVKQRIDSLRNDSEGQWGKMSVAQEVPKRTGITKPRNEFLFFDTSQAE